MKIGFGGEDHEIHGGSVIGVIGDTGSGVSSLLQAAGGRFIGPGHELDLQGAPVLALGYVLDLRDAVQRVVALADIEAARRAGAVVLLASHDSGVLRAASDEIWWVHGERVAAKGDPGEVLDRYARHTIEQLRAKAAGDQSPLLPTMRRGDGRAVLESIETLNANGERAAQWMSGDAAIVRVTVRFEREVADPVVGIMIRTRIGMEVYGTNTELERVKLGPCRANERRVVEFRFTCNLCPQSYTITAASHDPDGVWHDWMEDALAVSVADTRYTAGVANLRAEVRLV